MMGRFSVSIMQTIRPQCECTQGSGITCISTTCQIVNRVLCIVFGERG